MGFNPRERGTSEAVWQPALRDLPLLQAHGSPLTVVAPHPDDETLGAGGLIHAARAAGFAVTIVLVTDGEKACPEIPDLSSVRADECARALDCLGPGIEIVRLGLPDGDVEKFERELFPVIERLTSPASQLVGPYENDGHTDHDAVGRVCVAVASFKGSVCLRYPIWAWHRLQPSDFAYESLRRCPLSLAAQRAKQLAIDCYESQLTDRAEGAVVPPHVRGYFSRPYEVYLA